MLLHKDEIENFALTNKADQTLKKSNEAKLLKKKINDNKARDEQISTLLRDLESRILILTEEQIQLKNFFEEHVKSRKRKVTYIYCYNHLLYCCCITFFKLKLDNRFTVVTSVSLLFNKCFKFFQVVILFIDQQS